MRARMASIASPLLAKHQPESRKRRGSFVQSSGSSNQREKPGWSEFVRGRSRDCGYNILRRRGKTCAREGRPFFLRQSRLQPDLKSLLRRARDLDRKSARFGVRGIGKCIGNVGSRDRINGRPGRVERNCPHLTQAFALAEDPAFDPHDRPGVRRNGRDLNPRLDPFRLRISLSPLNFGLIAGSHESESGLKRQFPRSSLPKVAICPTASGVRQSAFERCPDFELDA